jgi:pimeloyl-ACP methyl ester carboxylesterase
VLLAHGASLAIDAYATWCRAMPALADGYRVIAPDLLGFGATGGRHRDRLQRTDHLLAFVDALGLSDIAAVGHSEGGFLCSLMAIRRPDLVRKLVIVVSGATCPLNERADEDGSREAGRFAYDYASGASDTEAGFMRANAILSRRNPPDFLAYMRESYRRAVARGQLQDFKDVQSDVAAYTRLQEEHVLPFFGKASAQTLLIWPDRDPTVPVQRGLALLGHIPGAEMHILPDAAHMVMLDKAEAFNRILRYWLDQPCEGGAFAGR